MIDDPLSLLTAILWLAALAPWPVAFLFGACSACCEQECPWMLNYERCLYWENIALETRFGVTGVQTGDTARVTLRRASNDRLIPGGFPNVVPGNLTFDPFSVEISNLQSQIQVPIRVSVSASGDSRTPVGDTRTQVWRFNRPAVTNNVYDFLGPEWHLEVELSVTGVDTQEEAGVTTSIGADSEGQPKLFVSVNQWTETITRDETVTLFPVGVQRWSGIGTSFQLTTSTATATRVAGDDIPGWTVSKLSGLTINARALAVRITQSGTTGRVFLREPDVLEFLDGERTLTTPSQRFTILPNHVLCGIAESDLLSVNFLASARATALGLMPSLLKGEYFGLAVGGIRRCPDPFPVVYGGCVVKTGTISDWFAKCNDPSVEFQQLSNVKVEQFYGGRTLLWMLLNPPYTKTASISALWPLVAGGITIGVEWEDTPTVTPIQPFPTLNLPPFTAQSLDDLFCVLSAVTVDGLTFTTSPGSGPWTATDPDPPRWSASAQKGDCYWARIMFHTDITDGTTTDGCGRIFYSEFANFTDTRQCADCTPSVSIVSGAEYASVTYLESGEKVGLIEIVALTTWLGGQGVTFTVTCGDESITTAVLRTRTVPLVPQALTAARNPCSEVVLEWDEPEWNGGHPITGYLVQVRPIGGSYTTVGTFGPDVFTATVTGLVRVGYEFRVAAISIRGTGPFRNVTVDFALTAPTGLTLTREPPCTSVELSWTPPATAECVVVASYLVQFRLFGTTPWTTAATLTGDAVTGTVTGLTAGTRYQFRVGSVDEVNVQRFTGFLTSGNLPATPTGVTPELGSNPGEVDVAWNAVEESCFENTGYLVQFRPSTTSTWSDGPTSVNKFATVTGLTAGVNYFFRVRATNSVGNSGFSAQSASITIPIPDPE